MSFPGLAASIRATFDRGIKSGAVVYTQTTTTPLRDGDLTWRIKFAPALGKKPSKSKSSDGSKSAKKPRNPFKPPYEPDLLVNDDIAVGSERFVNLLNKFCVEPRHFLLVTREFEPQDRPLSPLQLLAAHQIVSELSQAGEPTLCFFNRGPESDGLPPIDAAIAAHESKDGAFSLPDSILPCSHFIHSLPPQASADDLIRVFMALLDSMVDSLRSEPAAPKLANLSYNLLISPDWMLIAPRSKESFERNGESISVNALGFSGLLLVKTQGQLDLVQSIGIREVLRSVGWPRTIQS